LPTARGSGTDGYVQRNWAFVRKSKDKVIYKTEEELEKLEATSNRQPNREILKHERKRKVEVKCIELEDILEHQGYSQTEIETGVAAYQNMLLNNGGNKHTALPRDEFGRVAVRETHQIAEAQQEKNAKLREAFGISEYFVEGSSLDPQQHVKEAQVKAAAEQNKKYTLVCTPSPVPAAADKDKDKDKDNSDKIKKRKRMTRESSSSPETKRDKKKKSKKHKKDRSESPKHSKKKVSAKDKKKEKVHHKRRRSSSSSADSSSSSALSDSTDSSSASNSSDDKQHHKKKDKNKQQKERGENISKDKRSRHYDSSPVENHSARSKPQIHHGGSHDWNPRNSNHDGNISKVDSRKEKYDSRSKKHVDSDNEVKKHKRVKERERELRDVGKEKDRREKEREGRRKKESLDMAER
jgi:serine/arginine repetitive matrix protein 2